MPKYLLLKHYRGGPQPHRPVPPMDQWAPEDVEAHMGFLKHVSELLEENGEYVDAQALTPARTWVRYGGPDAAPVTTDGPHPETSDLIAGWWRSDRPFCVAVGFLALVFAIATVTGVIMLLQRRPVGRYLIAAGAVVALLTYGGVFIAGALVGWIVHTLPVLPIASVVLALHPQTKRWLDE